MGCETDSGWHLGIPGLDRGQTNDMDVSDVGYVGYRKQKSLWYMYMILTRLKVRFPSKVRN